jgi:hypothetical protein
MYMAARIQHADCRLETYVLKSVEEISKIKIAGTEPAMYPTDSRGRITSLVRLGVKNVLVFEKR